MPDESPDSRLTIRAILLATTGIAVVLGSLSILVGLSDEQQWWLRPLSERWWKETVCSMLVGIACGVLGCYVILRRMALIGDALSHAVLPGVVIAFLITQSAGVFGLLTGALLAGLLTAVLINLVSRFSRTKEDSSIGIVFTALFAIGIILISAMPRGAHFDLDCYLFGDPLAVGTQDLVLMAIVCPLVLVIIALLYHPLKLASFDPVVAAAMGLPVMALHYLLMGMLSATVVAGLKTTGVVLVVALVITPASAAYLLSNRLSVMMVLSGIFGAASALVGMTMAFVFNWPSGASMVVFATAIFGVVMLLSPSQGLVTQAFRRWRIRRHVESEDVLKAVYRNAQPDSGWCYVNTVVEFTKLTSQQVTSIAKQLVREGLMTLSGGRLQLTDAGQHRAVEMVRAHRLWESYLTQHANVDAADVHDQAEELEHVHELADAVDETLGHPTVDPHGEEIPQARSDQ
jgi:ABC-type Mn2+/Zn2+ transport system permease subunit/Mn-dependent DtxR family transcriptional regulator